MSNNFPLLNDKHLPLHQIVINDELEKRPSPQPNYKAENEGLRRLARVLADDPSSILKELAEVAMQLCGADSAGISLAEEAEEASVFRWHAVSGALSRFLNGTMPRDFSPCGVVLDRAQAQLMRKPIGHFDYIEKLGMPLYEVMLVPFNRDGKPIGTIWVVAQRPGLEFHREDLRALRSLAEFAAAAVDGRLREQAVRDAHEVAERANAAKSAFLANMSHEIRTPLGAIMGFAEMLRDDDLDSKQRRESVETIQRNSSHLLELINDILDLSKVESGKMEIEQQRVDICAIVQDLEATVRPKAAEKGLHLSFEVRGSIPRYILTDVTRFRQILLNVLCNAVKFTDAGSVRAEFSVEASVKPGKEACVVSVSDTGCGLDADQAARLFQSFVQADSTTTRKYGGTGLGLALSRKLAEALGGTLTLVRSDVGVGSTFAVSVPLEIKDFDQSIKSFERSGRHSDSAVPSTKSIRRQRLDGMRVLVAEDTLDNQRLVAHILRQAGCRVEVVSNGLEGARRGLRETFDVILMDIQMPILDGYSATARLRAGGFQGPIIALTAHAMLEERTKCLAAGCTDSLTKPIDRAQMLEVMSRYLDLSGHEASPDFDDEIFADIYNTFLDETFPEILGDLEAAISSDNVAAIARSAHMLMGSVAVYRERALSVVAKDLEREAKAEGRESVMRAGARELRVIYERLVQKQS